VRTRRRPADYDERLALLFEAKRRHDYAYLIEALRREHDVSLLPARWLADAGVVEAVPTLVELLDASDPVARSHAIMALQKLGFPEEARPRLVEMARADEDRYVRGWAASVLGEFNGGREITRLLVSLLADPDWFVSSGAAAGLGRHGDVLALPPLRARLRQLRRSPLRWYRYRLRYRHAIAALETRMSAEGQSSSSSVSACE
jgi:HEAT repeat protein